MLERWGSGRRRRLALFCALSIVSVGCGDSSPSPADDLGAVTGSAVAPARPSPPRNVVLICLDTVRFDVFRALDEVGDDPFAPWSAKALHFDRAQSSAPWTVPAVASALTGLDPQRHGAGRFPEAVANLGTTLPSVLPDDVPSLPDLLRQRGFRTRGFVAHAWFRSKFGLARGLEVVDYDANDAEVLRRALAWLQGSEADGTDPFLLYLHFMRAHRHIDWDEQEVQRRHDRLTPAQRAAVVDLGTMPFCKNPQGEPCRRFLAYAESVARMRAQLTWLMAVLEDRGRLQDTVVVLFSDHGEEFMDHAATQRSLGVDPRGIFGHGHGQSLYQELVHVPLLVWHPELEGGRTERAASLVDIAPSVMNWLGFDVSDIEFDGESLGPSTASPKDSSRAIYSSGIAFGPQQQAVVRGNWKRVSHTASQERELFDLREDPNERSPVANARVAEDLDRLLDAHAARSGRASERRVPELSQDELRALQDLGYLEEAGP